MSIREITIAVAELDAFRRATMLAYGSRAEALAHEVGRALGVDADVVALDARRRDLDAAATVIEQVGWTSTRPPSARKVVAEPALLEAIFRSMLIAASEELSATAESAEASVAAVQRMRGAAGRIATLLDRLADVRTSEAASTGDRP